MYGGKDSLKNIRPGGFLHFEIFAPTNLKHWDTYAPFQVMYIFQMYGKLTQK